MAAPPAPLKNGLGRTAVTGHIGAIATFAPLSALGLVSTKVMDGVEAFAPTAVVVPSVERCTPHPPTPQPNPPRKAARATRLL